MVGVSEKQVLEIIGKRQLMSKSELRRALEQNNIPFDSIETLKGQGFLNLVQLGGEGCLAITQKGMRALND